MTKLKIQEYMIIALIFPSNDSDSKAENSPIKTEIEKQYFELFKENINKQKPI